MIWIVSFIRGLFSGIPFGVIFNIPRYGKAIILVLACMAGLYAMVYPTTVSEFVTSISSYNGIADLVGIIIGMAFGRSMLESTTREWDRK